MTSITNKIVLFLFLIGISVSGEKTFSLLMPATISLALSCFMEYFENDLFNFAVLLCFCLLCLLHPIYAIFLPLISYDLLYSKYQASVVISLALLFVSRNTLGNRLFYLLFLAFGLMVLMTSVSKINLSQVARFAGERDNLSAQFLLLEKKLEELSRKQDEDIEIATLNERNRIAREIHDNVGHLLSRSLLQTGALLSTTRDPEIQKSLGEIKNTLDDCMDSIRSSVHNLRDRSIDLESQLEKMASDFSFCPVYLDYQCPSSLNIKAVYAIIAITGEALNNVARHSDASEIHLKLFEHTAFLQLIISDNGKTYKNDDKKYPGIGLESMRQRVDSLGGHMNIHTDHGFQIFISFPKENAL